MNINKLVECEFEKPTHSGAIIPSKVLSVVTKLANAMIDVQEIMTENEQTMVNHVYGGKCNFLRTKQVDHAVLHFVHNQLEKDIRNSIRKEKQVLLIGTTYSQWQRFSRELPNVEFYAVFGRFDSKDHSRLSTGKTNAESDLRDPTKVKTHSKATEFLHLLNNPNIPCDHCCFASALPTNWEFNYAILVDSLYDMSQQDFLSYTAAFNIRHVLATMLFVPEITIHSVSEAYNYFYSVCFFKLNSKQIAMRHLNGSSHGYVHDAKVLSDWQKHIMFQDGKSEAFLMEVVKNIEGYALMKFDRIFSSAYTTVVHIPRFTSHFRRIFHPIKFFKKGIMEYHYVDRAKYEECYSYAIRLTIGAFEPTKITTYLVMKMHKVIIGGKEFSRSWDIEERTMNVVILFILFHSAMVRGEMFKWTSEVVQRSKDGGLDLWWFQKAWNRICDWFTMKEKRKLLNKIDDADREISEPYYVHRVSTSLKLDSTSAFGPTPIIPAPPPPPPTIVLTPVGPLKLPKRKRRSEIPEEGGLKPYMSKSYCIENDRLRINKLRRVCKEPHCVCGHLFELNLHDYQLIDGDLVLHDLDSGSDVEWTDSDTEKYQFYNDEESSGEEYSDAEGSDNSEEKSEDEPQTPDGPESPDADEPDQPPTPRVMSWASEASEASSSDFAHVDTAPSAPPLTPERPVVVDVKLPKLNATKPVISAATNMINKSVPMTVQPNAAPLEVQLMELCSQLAKEEQRIFSSPSLTKVLEASKSRIKKFGTRAGVKFESLLSMVPVGSTVLDVCAAPGASSLAALARGFGFVETLSLPVKAGGVEYMPEVLKNSQILTHGCDIMRDNIFKHGEEQTLTFLDNGYDLVLADGAEVRNEVSRAEQEATNHRLLSRQLYIASQTVKIGGSLIIKVFSMSMKRTRITLFPLLAEYEIVFPVKPVGSATTNAECYIVCLNRLKRNDRAVTDTWKSGDWSSFPQTTHTHFLTYAVQLAKRQLDSLREIKAEERQHTHCHQPPQSTDPVGFKPTARASRYSVQKARLEGKKWSDKGFNMTKDKAAMMLHEYIFNYKMVVGEPENWSSDLHEKIAEKYRDLVPLDDYNHIKVSMEQMVAGAGKTHRILQKFDPATDLYISPLKALCIAMNDALKKKFKRTGMKCCWTYEKCLKEVPSFAGFTRIFIDECTLLPVHYYLLLFTLAPEAEFILVGDLNQCAYSDIHGFLRAGSSIVNYTAHFPKPTMSNVTYRFGPRVSAFLRNNILYDIQSHSCPQCGITHPAVPDTQITISDFDGRMMDAELNVCFSDATRSWLKEKGVEVKSAREAQGMSVPKVNVFISGSARDLSLYDVRELAIVAFSRASHHLNIVDLDNTFTSSGFSLAEGLVAENVSVNFEIGMKRPIAIASHTLEHETVDPDPRPETMPRVTEFDPMTLEKTMTSAGLDLQQERHAFVFEMPKVNASVNAAAFFKPSGRDTVRFTPNSFGKKYTNSTHQLVWTATSRLSAKNTIPPGMTMHVTKSLAEDLRKKFLKPEIDYTYFETRLSKESMRVWNKYKSRGVFKDIEPVDFSLHSMIRMFNKAQVKIKNEFNQTTAEYARTDAKDYNNTFGNKPGQPILAWAKELNTTMCAFFSTLEKMFVEALKPEFVYANTHRDEEIEEKLNAIEFVTALCADISEFDSRQQKATQHAEYCILQMLCQQDITDVYYSLREGMKVISNIVQYFQKGKKSSGEPATLFTNTLVCMIIMMLVFPEMSAGIFKGDDSCCFSKLRNPKIDERAAATFMDCNIKKCLTNIPEFCGYIYGNGVWCYDMRTWAKKILDRDYSVESKLFVKELREMQVATKDKLRGVGTFGSKQYSNCIAVHTAHTGAPPNHVQTWFEQARAFQSIEPEKAKRLMTPSTNDVSNAY